MKRAPLSSQQQAVLAFYKSYLRKHDFPPLLSEVAAACGITYQRVDQHVRRLVSLGHLRRAEGRANRCYQPAGGKP